jgi:GYF domain 2
MSIYINKNNRQLGPFDESKVREMLAAGQLSPDDAAIRHGETQWQKLGEIIPQTVPAIQAAPKKSRKGLLLGCGGFFLVLILIGGVLGILAFRNLRPAD